MRKTVLLMMLSVGLTGCAADGTPHPMFIQFMDAAFMPGGAVDQYNYQMAQQRAYIHQRNEQIMQQNAIASQQALANYRATMAEAEYYTSSPSYQAPRVQYPTYEPPQLPPSNYRVPEELTRIHPQYKAPKPDFYEPSPNYGRVHPTVDVQGYTRGNGTYVEGYQRTLPGEMILQPISR